MDRGAHCGRSVYGIAVLRGLADLTTCGTGHFHEMQTVKVEFLSAFGNAMKVRVVLEYDADARAFSAVCPELPGCASAGDTEEEEKQNIKEAIELYLAPSDVELSRDAKLNEVTVG